MEQKIAVFDVNSKFFWVHFNKSFDPTFYQKFAKNCPVLHSKTLINKRIFLLFWIIDRFLVFAKTLRDKALVRTLLRKMSL